VTAASPEDPEDENRCKADEDADATERESLVAARHLALAEVEAISP
jgi:hypothetical protein